MENQLRQDLWRAGHAHAGVLLVLALVVLRYVDQANLSAGWKWLTREAVPAAAILLPVLSPDATEPNALIYLAYVGAVLLAVGLFTPGVGKVTKQGAHPQMSCKAPSCHDLGRNGSASGMVLR
jgi:uncharacterized membrane protein